VTVTDSITAATSATLTYSVNGGGPNVVVMTAAGNLWSGVIPGQVSRIPMPGLDRGASVKSLAEFADRLAELPLVYQPGSQWSYSVSLDLLGRVIEVVSGKSFDDFLLENIFVPAGMYNTFFRVPGVATEKLTSNYGVMAGTLLPLDPAKSSIYLDKPAFPFGGAGLVSSPRDYDLFLRMLAGYGTLHGKRVISELAVRVGTSNLLPEGANTKGTMIDGAGFGAGGRIGLAGAQGTYGWGGAAGTVAFVNFRHGLRGSLFTQYMPSEAYPIHREFPLAVQADLALRRKPA